MVFSLILFLRGSENHLLAFVSTLEHQVGETYRLQVLDQATYDEIVSASSAGRVGNDPPYSITDWIRTGVGTGTSSQVGAGNCALWTTNDSGFSGATVALNPVWMSASNNLIPWAGVSASCNTAKRVWCVQD